MRSLALFMVSALLALMTTVASGVEAATPADRVASVGDNEGEIVANGREWWEYQGQQGEILEISTEANWDTVLMVFDSEGREVAYNDDASIRRGGASLARVLLPSTGRYIIEVTGYYESDFGLYTLTIKSIRYEDRGLIQFGEHNGNVNAGGAELWRFESDRVQVATLVAQATWDTTLTIYHSSGYEVAFNDDSAELSGYDAQVSVTFYPGVTYHIAVQGYGADSAGTYDLVMEPTVAQQAEIGTMMGSIEAGGLQQWRYEGDTNEVLTVTTEANWDTVLLAYDEAGEEVAYNDDHANLQDHNSQVTLTLPVSGSYWFVVMGYSRVDYGQYTLSIDSDAKVDGGTPQDENSPARTITEGVTESRLQRNTEERWQYTGQSGHVLLVATDATWDTILTLYGPDGNEIAYNDDNPVANDRTSRLVVRLPASGVYTIGVEGFFDNSHGPFTLNLASVVPTTVPTGTYDTEIAASGIHVWSYEGERDETITLTTRADWDTMLTVYSADGTEIGFNDDGPGLTNYNSQLVLTLPATDTYIITVEGYSSADFGTFELDIELGDQTGGSAGQSVDLKPLIPKQMPS